MASYRTLINMDYRGVFCIQKSTKRGSRLQRLRVSIFESGRDTFLRPWTQQVGCGLSLEFYIGCVRRLGIQRGQRATWGGWGFRGGQR